MRELEFANAWVAPALDAATAPAETAGIAQSDWSRRAKELLRVQGWHPKVPLTLPSPLPGNPVGSRQDGEMVGPWVVELIQFSRAARGYLACDAFGRMMLGTDITAIGFFLARGDALLADWLALLAQAAQEGLDVEVTCESKTRSFKIKEADGFEYTVPASRCDGQTPGLVPGRPQASRTPVKQ